MGNLIFLGAVVLVLFGIAILVKRLGSVYEIPGVTDTDEFTEGYELCIDVCSEVDGLSTAKESAEAYQKDKFTAHRYGFVCAYSDITSSTRPKPWGKA